jgi:hypothetical protein
MQEMHDNAYIRDNIYGITLIVLLTTVFNNDRENNRHVMIKMMSNIDEKSHLILSVSTDSAKACFLYILIVRLEPVPTLILCARLGTSSPAMFLILFPTEGI